MTIAILLIVIAAAAGTLLSYACDDTWPLLARCCAGLCVGFALLGIVAFLYASFLGLTPLAIILSAATLLCSLTLLARRSMRARLIVDLRRSGEQLRLSVAQRPAAFTVLCVTWIMVVALLARFAGGAVFTRAGAIFTNAINNIGDLPLHVSLISSFLFGENFPPEHPQFAGARLTYPFIADFLTALFMRAGAELSVAIFAQTFLLLLALVFLTYHWAVTLTRDRAAAVFSVLLLLLSGGMGWWLFGDDVRNGGNPLAALMHLSHEYTTEAAAGFRWGNLLETILLPQRSALLGIPLVIIICSLWWQALDEPTSVTRVEPLSPGPELTAAVRRMLGAGVIAGLLPLVHTTSFIVMMAMAGCLLLLFPRWRHWAAFFAAAVPIALVQVWWFGQGTAVHAKNMFGWQFGWDRGAQNAVWFWIKNAGLFIPLLLVALCWRGRDPVVPRRLARFYAPFVLCFVVPNVVRLMPWVWDNIKALIIWYIASVPLVALLLARLWRRGRAAGRIAAILLLISMTLAGSLDVWRVVAKTSEWAVFDADTVACGETIKANTPPRALILHAPINNDAVFLTGRRSLLGLTFMAWVHGLNYGSRESDIGHIYTGAPDAEELLKHYSVDYLVVGPAERNRLKIDDAFLSKFPVISRARGCELRKITRE